MKAQILRQGKITRLPAWVCICGHRCNAASSLFGDDAPKAGDVSACINCGMAYEFDGKRMQRATMASIEKLNPEERREFELTRAILLATTVKPGGRA